jgi:L-Ala-D/L-Glu epimerase
VKIRSLETFRVRLPFRFAFKHALASRQESSNLVVKVTLENGCCGWGESVPRDYVTGETLSQSEDNVLLKYAPLLSSLKLDSPPAALVGLKAAFDNLALSQKAQGASWCALELAVLDAVSRQHGMGVCDLFGRRLQERIRYGGVMPFGSKKALAAILWFYKFYGYETVKLKVGSRNLEDDLERVRLARRILGPDCRLRVDANCAWTLAAALAAAESMRPYGVLSYEQPLAADDWQGLKTLSDSIPEDVIVDESLCTLKQARELADGRICNAFNIRISKAGGLAASLEMVRIAAQAGLKVHLGAQVGESGILSAAARHLAVSCQPMENYEGSANFFLLKKDICRENLTAGPGGYADLKYARGQNGLGLSIDEARLSALTEPDDRNSPEAAGDAGGQTRQAL